MITRIEIDGFKSFSKFAVDLEPFTVIAGANASGKSNLFDALQLLSRLAEYDVQRAFEELRGEPDELFRWSGGQRSERMSFAVEVLLERKGQDQLGQDYELSHTRVRYSLELTARRDEHGVERVEVSDERALSREETESVVCWVDSPIDGDNFLVRSMRDSASSRPDASHMHYALGRTMLSAIVSAQMSPHMYALREEMRSWRLLALDPSRLREASPRSEPDRLASDGHNLPRVLERLQAETRDEQNPTGVIADISADLSAIVPGVRRVSVTTTERVPRESRLEVEFRDEGVFSARILSEGTLRVLALLTLLHDPRHRGVLLFEEPENGVHPGHVRELVERLQELTTDLEADPDDLPLRQLIVNTHSPVVVAAVDAQHLVFADVVTRGGGGQPVERVTRMRRANGSASADDETPVVTGWEIERYLNTARPES